MSTLGKYFGVFLLFTVVSCRVKELKPFEYVKWIDDDANGLNVKKEIGEYEFSVIYKPLEYIVLMETKDQNIKKDFLQKRMKELGNMQYFTFRVKSKKNREIMRAGIKSENEYYSRLEYFVSDAQDDISLIEGKDTLSCLLYHFERNYGVSPSNSIVLGFEKDRLENSYDKTLVFNDHVLGVGPICLTLKNNDINKLPALITY